MNKQPERLPDTSAEPVQLPQPTEPSDKPGASWAEGALPPGKTGPNSYTEQATPAPRHHLQAQALLPYARRIAVGLGQQEHKLRDELTPILNEARILAATLPSHTVSQQQTEFIIATICSMMQDATEAQQRAKQVVNDLENELAKGPDPPHETDTCAEQVAS